MAYKPWGYRHTEEICFLTGLRSATLNVIRYALSGGLLAISLLGSRPALAASGTDENSVWQELPRNTALVISLNTTETTWSNLNQFRITQLLNQNFGITPNPGVLPYLPNGIDYQTYIQPWVGNQAVIALLPSLGGLPADMPAHFVMIAPIADQDSFADYFEVLLDRQGTEPLIETFRQTDMYYWPADLDWHSEQPGEEFRTASSTLRFTQVAQVPVQVTSLKALPEGDGSFELDIPLPVPEVSPSGLAVAVLPHALIAADNPSAIKTFLRYRQGSQGRLANSPQFQRTLGHREQSQALITIYGNVIELLRFDPLEAPLDPLGLPFPNAPVSPPALSTLRNLDFGGTLEAFMFPSELGMEFQGRFYYDSLPFTLGITPSVPTADSVLDELPASTYLLMSGRDLAGVWQQMTRIIPLLDEDFSHSLNTLREGFTALTGLDLDRDIFGWMDQEIAFAAFPAQGTPFEALSPQLHLGLGMLIQTSDRAIATQTLSTVDDLITTLGFGVTAGTVNDHPITSWNLWSGWDSSPGALRQSLVSHGWINQDTVAIVSGEGAMARVMNPSPHDPLREFPLFQDAVGTFPDPNDGYFYVNAGATLALIYQIFNLHEIDEFQTFTPFLGSFRSLSATTTQTADYIELDAQLGLAQRED